MDNFAAIDFETANYCRSSVCSVGVVIVRNGMITDRFYSLIHPYPDYYNQNCVDVHGLTAEDTDDAPTFPEVWDEVSRLIGNLPLVAHNSSFDRSCLRSVFDAYGMDYPDYPFYCTLKASRSAIKNLPNYRLPTVASVCGYELENHHNAIADAEACAYIALAIL